MIFLNGLTETILHADRNSIGLRMTAKWQRQARFIILSYFHHQLILSYIYSTINININLDDKGLGQQIQLHNSLDAGFCQE